MGGKKILIVDDEPDIAEVLGDRLEAEGYEIRIVHRAKACYAAVVEDAPDLILMDIQMPEISGMEALVEMKTHHPQIPILMVSASTTQTVAQEAINRGAVGFLLKPFEPADLMQKVTEVLG
ncbi:MAG: response regulator [Candidatus Latescibacteria bacterium]|jgi:CheY-like chemotaxis protein|nr:response regulator [Candidatus Latescibacterota bacterium]MBT4138325.1 response regulator [Candidatus Latescibacterota bacterium]MBT5832280.1 response regulator [Candidatus Latescibacterota bacterium]